MRNFKKYQRKYATTTSKAIASRGTDANLAMWVTNKVRIQTSQSKAQQECGRQPAQKVMAAHGWLDVIAGTSTGVSECRGR